MSAPDSASTSSGPMSSGPMSDSITPSTSTVSTSTSTLTTSSSTSTPSSMGHAGHAMSNSSSGVAVPAVEKRSAAQRTKTARIRLLSDLNSLMNDAPEGCSASPASDEDLFEWKACVFGPADTPWEGGVFQLRLQFTQDYPQEPPRVRFVSRMFHPNIFRDGSLCLDIIQTRWSPIYTVATILTSIQSLLQDPNPDSPADREAASLFMENRKAYNKMVRKCVSESL